MSLAIRYRPKNWVDMLGNEEVIKSLRSLESKKNRPSAFLLTGPSGCGKTTAARILSRYLGAIKSDFVEIDSGDFRGIDTIRMIRQQVPLKPMYGRARVWLIDECHKLTNDAQNALLKVLEEPPSHVSFILATTDPNRLLKTIRTRCVSFEFSSLEKEEIRKLLNKVCKEESKKVQSKVLSAISEGCQGSPRQALSMLEQVIDIPYREQTTKVLKAATEESQIIDLCRALINQKPWKQVAQILKKLESDPESVRRAVLGYCSAVLLNGQDRSYLVLSAFLDPFYDSGKPGLVAACFEALNSE